MPPFEKPKGEVFPMRWGFFRCYHCCTVVYVPRNDLMGANKNFEWDSARGDLYVECCGVCKHWRHYEPLGDLKVHGT